VIQALSRTALLVLADGTSFDGVAIGIDGMAVGEVVFNTAMTGYQEILSDPSYARQIVTLTAPHIGNTRSGVRCGHGPCGGQGLSGPRRYGSRQRRFVFGVVLMDRR